MASLVNATLLLLTCWANALTDPLHNPEAPMGQSALGLVEILEGDSRVAIAYPICRQQGEADTSSADSEDRFDLHKSLEQRGMALPDVKRVVKRAFELAHQGYSSDEVLLDDTLNQAFLAACQKQMPGLRPLDCNWALLNLRKAGQLGSVPTTQRRRSETEPVLPIAEMAARSVLDQHAVSIDQMLADPELRAAFEQRVREIASDTDLYLARKAVFRLRKSRRLQPELITRIADWNRQILRLTVQQIRDDFACVPDRPGIYIFRDSSGYLYIGQSEDLRTRMESHLTESSSAGLAHYLTEQPADQIQVELHVFPRDSRMKEVRIRRAYESELIRSRKPRFNILP